MKGIDKASFCIPTRAKSVQHQEPPAGTAREHRRECHRLHCFHGCSPKFEMAAWGYERFGSGIPYVGLLYHFG